jgi:cellulose synthase/poly-beta-1,6-N-acetylglucosamine synthase-like glycosyltransferase
MFSIIKTSVYNAFRLFGSIVWYWLPFKFFIVIYLVLAYADDIYEKFDEFSDQNFWLQIFEVLFLFKFLKVVTHTLSFIFYRPIPIPENPTIKPGDVTVIIPTVGAIDEPEFRETVNKILLNKPFEIIVVTVGAEKNRIAEWVCAEEVAKVADTTTQITVIAIAEASKRKQIFAGLQDVQTEIVALADDHVFWGPDYLKSALAPFEDPSIGGVGTNKRVRRDKFKWSYANFLNFIACNYLERHNFECTASVNIDHAVFVLSGRTVLYRTLALRHPEFEKEYLRETWFYGLVGKEGFNVDDDNLLTRFLIGKAGYKVWFQNSPESTMYTTLGEPGKFFKQMDRWIRTTWRSNSTSLLSDQTPWRTQPWSVYAVYFSSFVNFALFYDLALFITLWSGLPSSFLDSDRNATFHLRECFEEYGVTWYSPWGTDAKAEWLTSVKTYCAPELIDCSYERLKFDTDKVRAIAILAIILLSSKLIKPLPHFWRNPKDLLWIPGYVLFGYYHSFIKLKALLTVRVVSWGTHAGVK